MSYYVFRSKTASKKKQQKKTTTMTFIKKTNLHPLFCAWQMHADGQVE